MMIWMSLLLRMPSLNTGIKRVSPPFRHVSEFLPNSEFPVRSIGLVVEVGLSMRCRVRDYLSRILYVVITI